ncbi:DnaB-like helicase C-terminal domain-containing protein [Amycolatopsis magusensis]|uniref:DnaB-like helicase C-terminal domain-containing protein n=1 Tax=Amycolatopsis magusensis TaxID=882444 RepID=UPI003C2D2F6B
MTQDPWITVDSPTADANRTWRWSSELIEPWRERTSTAQQHIPSPWPEFNEEFSGGGFLPHRIITIAAPTGFGKSVAGIQIAGHAAEEGHAAVIFSAEMPIFDVYDRIVARKARVPLTAIEKRNLEDWGWRRYDNAADYLAELQLIIDDRDALSIEYIAEQARHHFHERGVTLVMIDYLQLLNSRMPATTREQEVARISRAVKALVQELPVTVVQLAQLNDDGRLRESRQIENDSNIVIIMRRPEDADDTCPYVEMAVTKNRNGRKGAFRVLFSGAYAELAPGTPDGLV